MLSSAPISQSSLTSDQALFEAQKQQDEKNDLGAQDPER